jgi:hypothetical protein
MYLHLKETIFSKISIILDTKIRVYVNEGNYNTEVSVTPISSVSFLWHRILQGELRVEGDVESTC